MFPAPPIFLGYFQCNRHMEDPSRNVGPIPWGIWCQPPASQGALGALAMMNKFSSPKEHPVILGRSNRPPCSRFCTILYQWWSFMAEKKNTSGKLTVCYGKWPFVVHIPIHSMVIFHSYVSLREGIPSYPRLWQKITQFNYPSKVYPSICPWCRQSGPGPRAHPGHFQWDPPKEWGDPHGDTTNNSLSCGYGDYQVWSNTPSTLFNNQTQALKYGDRPKNTSMAWTPENHRMQKWHHPLATPLFRSHMTSTNGLKVSTAMAAELRRSAKASNPQHIG